MGVPGTQTTLAPDATCPNEHYVGNPPGRWQDFPEPARGPWLGPDHSALSQIGVTTHLSQCRAPLCSCWNMCPQGHTRRTSSSPILTQQWGCSQMEHDPWGYESLSKSPFCTSQQWHQLKFVTEVSHMVCSISHPVPSSDKLRFTLLFAGSSSVPNPSCSTPRPSGWSTSCSDSALRFAQVQTQKSEAPSCLNFPGWVFHFILY